MEVNVSPGGPAGGVAHINLPEGVPALSLASVSDAERLLWSRWESRVVVDQSLVLISQVQRSGGTLVNMLLDGHPELHVYPYELRGGRSSAEKARWPVLDPSGTPDEWLDQISSPVLVDQFRNGYLKKYPATDGLEQLSTLPFTVVPSLVERLFKLLCETRPPHSQREVLDHHMTAFFNAWMDNQGLRERPKRWVTALTPRAAWGRSRERFFSAYPEGRVIASLRDPRAWWASASRFWSQYADFDATFPLWERGAAEMVAAKRERPDQVFLVTYEAIVQDCDRAMRALARWLGIGWHPLLLRPTFNRLPTFPNSSFAMAETGIRTESLERWRHVLDRREVATIERRALDLDAEVRAQADIA
jgi:hypothetical protein